MSRKSRLVVGCALACVAAIVAAAALSGETLRRHYMSRLPWKAGVVRDGPRIQTMASMTYALGCAVLEIGRVRIVLPGRAGITDSFASMTSNFDLPRGVGSVGRSVYRDIAWSYEGEEDGLHCDVSGLRFVIDHRGVFHFDTLTVDIESESVVYVTPTGGTELIAAGTQRE